jgi:hypothetical protein
MQSGFHGLDIGEVVIKNHVEQGFVHANTAVVFSKNPVPESARAAFFRLAFPLWDGYRNTSQRLPAAIVVQFFDGLWRPVWIVLYTSAFLADAR